MRIYIAGPYTNGDVAVNVRRAIDAADQLIKIGHIPYIPHLTHFWHLISPKEYKFWLWYDKSFLTHWADAVVRLEGDSHGADGEVELAKRLGITIYYSIFDIPLGSLEDF